MFLGLWLLLGALLVACGADSDSTASFPAQAGAADAGAAGSVVGDAAVSQAPRPPIAVQPAGPTPGAADTSPIVIDRCLAAGAPDPAAIDRLLAGGTPGSLRVLYPYDGTVFPRGLKAPLLMWDGAAQADAVYVHIKAGSFEYKGCGVPSGPGQFQIPEDVWEAAGSKTRGKADPFQVELSISSSGSVIGPVKTRWIIAQATIKGSIYYNSYSSLHAIASGVVGGIVLRIPPGGDAEPFVANECNGCHSVSANGARMVTQTLGLGGRSLDISGAAPAQRSDPARAGYAAMYPDGTRYVRPAISVEVARATLTAGLALLDVGAALVATDSSELLASPGLPAGALMPSFSADGKLLVFTDADANGGSALGAVDFDGASNSASNPRVLFNDASGETRPGWPFVLPDNQAVIFVRGGGDWSGNGAGLGGELTAWLGPYSELSIVDLDTKQSGLLARAMGYESAADALAGRTYLPFGPEDVGRAYFPTVSPVAAGGYFWVFFDALRHYGNLGLQRQLWGTAVEISPNGDYSLDRSNPAFYLPGQEFGTGNHRAFTALDACKMDGDSCTSGVDCCGGFCTLPPETELVQPVGTCGSGGGCAKTDERCTSGADCCAIPGQTPNSCIGGFCAQLPLL